MGALGVPCGPSAPSPAARYRATIDAFDQESKQHHITFNDGLERSMNLKKPRKKWQLVGYQQKDAEELV